MLYTNYFETDVLSRTMIQSILVLSSSQGWPMTSKNHLIFDYFKSVTLSFNFQVFFEKSRPSLLHSVVSEFNWEDMNASGAFVKKQRQVSFNYISSWYWHPLQHGQCSPSPKIVFCPAFIVCDELVKRVIRDEYSCLVIRLSWL